MIALVRQTAKEMLPELPRKNRTIIFVRRGGLIQVLSLDFFTGDRLRNDEKKLFEKVSKTAKRLSTVVFPEVSEKIKLKYFRGYDVIGMTTCQKYYVFLVRLELSSVLPREVEENLLRVEDLPNLRVRMLDVERMISDVRTEFWKQSSEGNKVIHFI